MCESTKDRLPQCARKVLLLLTVIGAIVLGYWAWSRGDRCSMPVRREIASIKVSHEFWAFQGDRKIPAFQIPEKHWDAILAALAPCEPDASPKKWEALCTLDLRTVENRDYRVEVFWLDYEGPGAFKVGVDEQFMYFRGGNSAQLRDAIIAAYKDSKTLTH
jgi:hypothetical protein